MPLPVLHKPSSLQDERALLCLAARPFPEADACDTVEASRQNFVFQPTQRQQLALGVRHALGSVHLYGHALKSAIRALRRRDHVGVEAVHVLPGSQRDATVGGAGAACAEGLAEQTLRRLGVESGWRCVRRGHHCQVLLHVKCTQGWAGSSPRRASRREPYRLAWAGCSGVSIEQIPRAAQERRGRLVAGPTEARKCQGQ
mmetsp:Transcript_111008/g.313018  ORF Transcript_111008/g.313018 Transcript_111008/m.313018 type:complete len:200 (+) Transcript_111008:232-831(+)